MPTELMQLTGGAEKLTPVQAMILAEMADETSAYVMQPSRVKIAPGGIGQFVMGDEMAKTFTAIVPISQINRGFWAREGTGSAPFCASGDGRLGSIAGEPSNEDFNAAARARTPHYAIPLLTQGKALPEFFDCATCPMNQWGSEYVKGNGRGKACKESRRLLLFIDGWAAPAVFVLPIMSIKPWDGYCSALRAKRSSYFGVKTKFELDSGKTAKGEPYNFIKVSSAGELDEDKMSMVIELRRQYMDLVRAMPVQNDEYETIDATASDEAPL
jgi:hypothetical protein